MKKNFVLLAICAAVCLFTSCSKEDNTGPTPSEGENESTIVSPEYVSVDWEKTEVYECNPETGEYSFSVNPETQKIQPGSVLAIDVDTMGYIAIVREVRLEDNKVKIVSDKGSLCDIFADYAFTLSTEDEDILTRSTTTGGNVFRPERIIYQDQAGNMTRSTPRKATSLTENIWEWTESFDGTELFAGSNYKVYLKEANYSASLDLNMELSFGQRTLKETVGEIYKQYQSKALSVKAYVTGKASSNFTLQADVFGKASIKSDEDELWKHNVFKPIRMVFYPQGIPVYITLHADMYRGASLELDGKISCYAGNHASVEGNLGFNWQQDSGISPIQSFIMENENVNPTIEGKGKITGETWLYPRLHVTLYELLGPSFDIKPYLGCDVEGGFREETLNTSNDYCAWSLRNYAGLDVSAGLSLMFMNYEVEHLDIGNINLLEKDLYKSPVNIEFVDATPEKARQGVQSHVRFKVSDMDYLFNREVATILPQIVKFEANGTLSSKYGIATGGIASVDWTPSSNDDVLKAVLYDASGAVIRYAEFKAEDEAEGETTCPDANHPHMINLGLPSGTRWACCNIGTTTPEGYGDYYRWAETKPCSEEDTFQTYPYDGANLGESIAGTSYDAARVSWGTPWKMPTGQQIRELFDNCPHSWKTIKGIQGRLFYGRSGASIFFPASGGRNSDGWLCDVGTIGNYWTATAYRFYYGSYYLYFSSGAALLKNDSRYYGFPVRAVAE